jgi:hypothetical protein
LTLAKKWPKIQSNNVRLYHPIFPSSKINGANFHACSPDNSPDTFNGCSSRVRSSFTDQSAIPAGGKPYPDIPFNQYFTTNPKNRANRNTTAGDHTHRYSDGRTIVNPNQ